MSACILEIYIHYILFPLRIESNHKKQHLMIKHEKADLILL